MPPPQPTLVTEMDYVKRKHPRLKQYDYSLPGYYYVTIHAVQDAPVFSLVNSGKIPGEAEVTLTETGGIIRSQLLDLEKRYFSVSVDKYVIMPTHIHVILQLAGETKGSGKLPALPEVVGAFKSLATRTCNQVFSTPGRKLFQTSFYETVLRNETSYQECWRYMEGNPSRWLMNSHEELTDESRNCPDTTNPAAGASPRPTGKENV